MSKDTDPSQDQPASANLYAGHETLPTKPIDQLLLDTNGVKNQTNVRRMGYDAHEGFVAVRDDNDRVFLAADTVAMRQRLDKAGYEHAGGGVPYTGANSGDRVDPNVAGKHNAMIAANLAAIDKGLRVPDYEQLSDEQKAELEALDIKYTDQMFGMRGALKVARGDSINPYTEEGRARLDQIGTFAEVVVPFKNNQEKGYKGVAVTDQLGNQFLAADCEALRDYLDATGFTETEEPFGYDIEEVHKFSLGAYEVSRAASMRSIEPNRLDNRSEALGRLKTAVVDLQPRAA